MPKSMSNRPRRYSPSLPKWVKPQLCKLVDKALQGQEWLHEIKYDGYRMHARLDRGRAQLLSRTGLDWTHKYPVIAAAVSAVPARQAYLDGELCGVRPDGKTSFSMIQTASDAGIADALVFFLFDLLYLDGDAISAAPLRERKERLRQLLSGTGPPLHFSDHQIGCGPEFYAKVCEMSLRASSPNALTHLFTRRSPPMGQGQVREPSGVHDCRVDRSRRCPSLARGALVGVLRSDWAARLCRARRGGY